MYIPTNPHQYIDQNGCRNCNLCFVMQEYDSGNMYYCLHDAPPRPKCGSISMGEKFNFKENKLSGNLWGDDYQLWEEWAKGKEVNPWGICGKWEEKEIDDNDDNEEIE